MPDGVDDDTLTRDLRLVLDPRAPVPVSRALSERARRVWRHTVERLAPLGGCSEGNAIDVFTSGDAAFTSMLEAIGAAHRRVWMESYIFCNDRLGQRVLEALTAAARRGVEVVLLYDMFGSPQLTPEVLRGLLAAGGRPMGFNPVWSFVRRAPMLIRDHRKILVVDDVVAFCGGMNISEDYAGPALGNGRFRDTHARMRGPCVADIATLFASSFYEASGTRLPVARGPLPRQDGVFVQVLGSNVRRRRRHIQRATVHTVRRSMRQCYMTSPYFVPPARLMGALKHAARRGVDVRILTAGLSDVPLVRMASQHLYGQLLKAGVRVYEMFGRTLHAKTATIDGVYASVGSFNLDTWSDRRNLEVNVTVLDGPFAVRLEQIFQADLALCEEVKLATWERRTWGQKLVHWCAYQLMRI